MKTLRRVRFAAPGEFTEMPAPHRRPCASRRIPGDEIEPVTKRVTTMTSAARNRAAMWRRDRLVEVVQGSAPTWPWVPLMRVTNSSTWRLEAAVFLGPVPRWDRNLDEPDPIVPGWAPKQLLESQQTPGRSFRVIEAINPKQHVAFAGLAANGVRPAMTSGSARARPNCCASIPIGAP